MIPRQAGVGKLEVGSHGLRGGRKQWVVVATPEVGPQIGHPFGEDLKRERADRKEPDPEGLAEFGFDFRSIEKCTACTQVDMLEFK